MADSETAEPRWLRTWATDITPGDLIRRTPDGPSLRVVDRDYPGAYSPIFSIKLGNGQTESLGKLSKVDIFDPDGSVERRVQMVLGTNE